MSAKPLNKREQMRIILPLLFIFLPSLAQAERLPVKTYTVADGLAHNTVNKIVRDSRGFLWFCTEEGLSRFDGYTFTNYRTEQGLPHPSINDLLETHAGDYWIATWQWSFPLGACHTHLTRHKANRRPAFAQRPLAHYFSRRRHRQSLDWFRPGRIGALQSGPLRDFQR